MMVSSPVLAARILLLAVPPLRTEITGVGVPLDGGWIEKE